MEEIPSDSNLDSKSKPMRILLGDSSMIMKRVITSSTWKRIMFRRKGANWTLDKTNLALYWNLGENIKTLNHQFMIYHNPTIYLFFNYRGNQPPMEFLDGYYSMINRGLGIKEKVKLIIVGMNYRENLIYRKNKKEILEWCLIREEEMGDGNCDYLELNQLLQQEF